MRVIIFGYGMMGKQIVYQCQKYVHGIEIIGISDNFEKEMPIDIPFISSNNIYKYNYDEVWITTVWFREIRTQLITECRVPEDKIHFVEPVMPVLEERILNKYRNNEYIFFEEIRYLQDHHARMYCYPFFDEYLNRDTEIGFDKDVNLFYGIYHEKRMYFSRKFDSEQKARKYYNELLMEQDKRCPHCYWQFHDMENITGNVVDVGAAEGIFGLNIIDQIDHLYMIEADEEWEEALKLTYREYLHKVTIIKKFVSDKDGGTNAKLDTLFSPFEISALKMDIEGMELQALMGAENILSHGNSIFVICTYHKQRHAFEINRLFETNGYTTEESKGWVLCQGDWEIESNETDFRKALVFAKRGDV